MSYFGTLLDDMIRRSKIKAIDLSSLSGVDSAVISRIRNDAQRSVSMDDLAKLATAISQDEAEQAELIRAHLLDEIPRSWHDHFEIKIRGEKERQSPAYAQQLPQELEECFAVLRENVIKDKNVREIIEGLGNLLRFGDVRTAEERGKRPNSPAKKKGSADREVLAVVDKHFPSKPSRQK